MEHDALDMTQQTLVGGDGFLLLTRIKWDLELGLVWYDITKLL